jgi:hypothetical protein
MVLRQVENNELNFEYLIEQCMSIIGGLEQSNTYGEDFKDGSDCKTVTLHKRKDIKTGNLYKTHIDDIFRKNDLIRCVVYNPAYDRLDFLLFKLSDIGFDKEHKKTLYISYNSKKDSYGKLDKYRVNTFGELCK